MTKEFRVFDRQAVLAELSRESRIRLRHLDLLETIDSTNLELQRRPPSEQAGVAVLADRQSAGRGRRGRQWHSPPGCNIYLSLGWRFQLSSLALAHLPLAVAVCLARALQQAGVKNPGIKWPNDIQVEGRKLAGVLIEGAITDAQETRVVIGIGANVHMPAEGSADPFIDQPWTDVCSHLSSLPGAGFRDRLCGLILNELLDGLTQYGATGFDSFRNDWVRLDVLDGKEVRVVREHETITGTAEGVGESGGLLVRVTDPDGVIRLQEYVAGEVRVRPVYNYAVAP